MRTLTIIALITMLFGCSATETVEPDMAKPGLADWTEEFGFGGP